MVYGAYLLKQKIKEDWLMVLYMNLFILQIKALKEIRKTQLSGGTMITFIIISTNQVGFIMNM